MRRERGEGGLHWDNARQRWIATVTVGYNSQGKRVTRKASGKTKMQAKIKLREMLRNQEDGLPTPPDGYTVADAVKYWLEYGLRGRSQKTLDNYIILARAHILPALGKRRLGDFVCREHR